MKFLKDQNQRQLPLFTETIEIQNFVPSVSTIKDIPPTNILSLSDKKKSIERNADSILTKKILALLDA